MGPFDGSWQVRILLSVVTEELDDQPHPGLGGIIWALSGLTQRNYCERQG
jgi:hypothetical protein